MPPAAPIEVRDLAAPGAWPTGLSGAEADLGGPLWSDGVPADLAEMLGRLPTTITEPTLVALQTDLLAAPGPTEDPGYRLLGSRIERLLAMGEAETALEVLAGAPEPPSPDLAALRVQAQLASGAVKPACEAVAGRPDEGPPWPEAELVCAALARDGTATELALDRLSALGAEVDPSLAGLARASVADGRYALRQTVKDDPVLLPLLRAVPIDIDAEMVREQPVPVRKALAANPFLASAARAAAVEPAPPPSLRTELNGTPPEDWGAAAAAVPDEKRARWAALVDGLGLAIPDEIWSGLAGLPSVPPAEVPDLAYWHGFDVASLDEQRGGLLLHLLLLLDGRPEEAAPVTLRRALDGLLALGLDQDAKALAAGTGGALGL
ncbi:MAG: hypothetical protein AB7O95_04820 [Geminicoccaceae bacterium]